MEQSSEESVSREQITREEFLELSNLNLLIENLTLKLNMCQHDQQEIIAKALKDHKFIKGKIILNQQIIEGVKEKSNESND